VRGQITPKPQDTPLGGRGSCRAPCVLSRAGAQQELRPPVMACKPGGSSTQAACFAPAPSRSRLVVARVVRHCPVAHVKPRGAFTPHPRPLSPSRGEGCRAMISGLSPSYTGCNSPVSNRHLIRVHSCLFVVQKHPSNHAHSWFPNTPPLVFIRGSKQRNPRSPSPLTPDPSPLPGARGAAW
jgi:hypothetical protein